MGAMAHPALAKAISVIGLGPMSAGLKVTYQAVRKWEAAGRLPRTEWTGETGYADRIVEMAGGAVTREQLLEIHRVPTRQAA